LTHGTGRNHPINPDVPKLDGFKPSSLRQAL
jgi:hypothetical protein